MNNPDPLFPSRTDKDLQEAESESMHFTQGKQGQHIVYKGAILTPSAIQIYRNTNDEHEFDWRGRKKEGPITGLGTLHRQEWTT